MTWGWLMALSPLPLLIWVPALLGVEVLVPAHASTGPAWFWTTLALTAVAGVMVAVAVGHHQERRLLAQHGTHTSRWWLPALLVASPVTVPLWFVVRERRTGTGLAPLLAWWGSWTSVVAGAALGALIGWTMESAWDAPTLAADIENQLFDQSFAEGEDTVVEVTCPADNWYVLHTTVTCISSDGTTEVLVDAKLDDYWENTITVRPSVG